MKIHIPWLSSLLLIIIFSSCRNDNVAPIRNVRFDPGLLNPLQAAGGGSCASYTYYYGNEAKSLGTIYSRMVLLSFDERMTDATAAEAMASYGFVEGLGQAVRTNSAKLYPVTLAAGLNCQQAERAMAELAKNPAVSYASPFFEANGQLLGISNEFIVQLEQGRQPGNALLQRLANATRTEIVMALSDDTYVLRADKNSRGNALQMANFFHEQPFVKHAEPDFVVSLPL